MASIARSVIKPFLQWGGGVSHKAVGQEIIKNEGNAHAEDGTKIPTNPIAPFLTPVAGQQPGLNIEKFYPSQLPRLPRQTVFVNIGAV